MKWQYRNGEEALYKVYTYKQTSAIKNLYPFQKYLDNE